MKKIKMNKVAVRAVIALLLFGMTLQVGFSMYWMAEAESASAEESVPISKPTEPAAQPIQPIQSTVSTESGTPKGSIAATSATSNVSISQDVLNKIRESDPGHYDRNVDNYKSLLVKLDVHSKYKAEIERLLLGGYRLPDVLIAFEFVYDEFGAMKDLEALAKQRQSGKTWDTVFQEYHQAHAPFLPRAFDSNELESLTKSGFSADDIMIADHVSFTLSLPVKQVISMKSGSRQWKDIKAELNILNTADALPRVQITVEQINRWTQSAKMTEEQVVEAFVLASKAGQKPEAVIPKLKSGTSPEAIVAEGYVNKYE